MADRTTRLRVVGDTTDAQQKLVSFGQQIEGFKDRILTGIGIDVAGRMMNMLERIPRALTQAVRIGVGFGSTMENTAISLAGIMQSIAPSSFDGFNDALETSRALVKVLREEAKMTTATFKDLVEATQGLIGPALSGGVPLQKVPALVSMVSRAVQAAMPGAPSYQILQEGRAMLTGQIGPDAQLAKQLGITNPMIRAAREQGRIFEFLQEKLVGFNQAAEASMQTLTGIMSNLADELDMSLGEAMQGALFRFKEFGKSLREFIATDEFKQLASVAGSLASRAAEAGGRAARWGARHGLMLDFLSMGLEFGTLGPLEGIGSLIDGDGFMKGLTGSWKESADPRMKRIINEVIGAVESATVTPLLNALLPGAGKGSSGADTDPLLNRKIKLAAQEELDKAAAARAKTADTWFKSLAGGVQRMRVEPAQGLYYTSGGSAAARETLGVQRKMLDALVRIHERLARGVKVDVDALAI